jgi:hypothetical protein
MKGILIFLVFSISCQVFSQTGSIEGKVIFKLDSLVLPGATVVVSGTRIGAQTDINGFFELSKLKVGKYNLIVEYLGYGKDTIQNVIVKDAAETKIIMGLPAGKCHERTDSKACPLDGKSKYVIPIVYGLPNRKTMRKMEKGKVKLGGCEVTGCEPYWFCEEHKKEF